MPSTFATGAIALVSLLSLVSANPNPAWERQAADNTSLPYSLGTVTATTTVTTLVTPTPSVGDETPSPTLQVLTCTDDIIAAGFSAEPTEAASFCSSFIGIPAVTVTTNGITTTITTTSVTTGTITSTSFSTTACATSIATVTTILSQAPVARRDALPVTEKAVLPFDHPFMRLERQASSDLAMSDCSTLISTFSNDCSCLFLPTQTTTVCGTTTLTATQRETVDVLTSTLAYTCSGTTVVTSTETLVIYTHPTTTMVSTVPATSILTGYTNSSAPALTSSPTSVPVQPTSIPVTINSSVPVTSSGAAETHNSTVSAPTSSSFSIPPFPTTSVESRVGTLTETLPGTTFIYTFTVPFNGTTVTLIGTTQTFPPITTTTTVLITETVTPVGSTGSVPAVNTTSAPYTFTNGTSPTVGPTGTALLTTAPTSASVGASTGVIPPVNTTSAPYTYPNGTAPATTPFPTGTAVTTQPLNYTTPPFIIGNETRSAPYSSGWGTGTAPHGTAPTSNPYFQHNATLTFNASITTTYTAQITTTAVQVYNTTVTTVYPSAYTSVVAYGSAGTTTIVGPTVYPSGTVGPFYYKPAPGEYTFVPSPAASSDADTSITAPTPVTTGAAKRWARVRKEVPRADMM